MFILHYYRYSGQYAIDKERATVVPPAYSAETGEPITGVGRFWTFEDVAA